MARTRTAILLAVILALAAVLRFAWIGKPAYFLDEFWNDEAAAGRGALHIDLADNVIHANAPRPGALKDAAPWWQIWTHMDHLNHPPLFIMTLRAWRSLIGESDVSSRRCVATISVLAILALFDVARRLHGTRVALWACLIMALSGAQIELAQQTRSYAMVELMGLCALDALLRIEQRGASALRTVALAAFVLAMVLTHYFAAPVALAIGVYVLLRFRGSDRRRAFAALVIAGAIFLLCWGPFLWQQRNEFTTSGSPWEVEPDPRHLIRTLARLASIPFRFLFEPPKHAPFAAYLSGVLLLLPWFLLRRRPQMLIWGLWIASTVFFIASLDLLRSTTHLMYIRYTILGAPAIYVLLAAMVQTSQQTGWRRWTPHLVPACIAIACAGALEQAYAVQNPDFKPLARYLDQHVAPGDVVVFYHSSDWYPAVMWLGTAYYSHTYPWAFVKIRSSPDAALRQQLAHAHSIWLVRGWMMDSKDVMSGATIVGGQGFPYVAVVDQLKPATQPDATSRATQPESARQH